MANQRDISMKIVLDGEREYKASCDNVNAALKTLKSESALVTAEYGKNTDSIEGLTAKQSIYQKECVEYEKTIEAAEKALEKFRTAGIDPSDASFQKMERNLNYNKAALLNKKQALEETEKALAAAANTSENYIKTVGEIDKSLSVLQAELKTVETAYKGNSDSTELLSQKSEALTKIHDEQAKKIQELTAAYEKSTNESGEMSDETVKLKLDLEKAKQEFIETGDKIKETGNATEKTGNKFEKLGGILKGVGAVLGSVAVAAGAAAGKLGTEVVQQFGELEQNLGGSEAVFQEYADNMQKIGEDAYKNMGVSQSQYLATANKMGALFQGSGLEVQKSAELTEKAMQRAADMASVMGIDMQVALDSVAGAAKGNFTMMDNLGISMNATTIEAYALAKGLDFTWQTATQAEKAEVAMQMFFENTEQYAGNFARESTQTISGSLGMLQAALSSFTAGLGNANADMTNLTENLVDAFQAVVENIVPVIENIISALPPAMDSISTAIKDLLPELVDTCTDLFGQVLEMILNLLPELIPVAVDAVMTIVGALIDNLPLIVSAAVELVTALINGIGDALPELIPAAVEAVTTIVKGLIENLPLILDAALKLVVGLADGILKSIPVLVEALPDIITAVVDFIIKAIPQIITAGVQLLTSLVTELPQIIEAIVMVIPQIIDGVVTAVIDNIPLLIEAGIDLLTGLADGLGEGIPKLVEMAPEIIEKLVIAIIGNTPKLIDAAFEIITQLVSGIIENLPQIGAAAGQIINALINGLAALREKLIDIGANIVNSIWNGITGKGDWLTEQYKGYLTEFGNGLVGKASSTGEKVGAAFVNGVDNGLRSASGGGFGKTVKDAFEESKQWMEKYQKAAHYSAEEELARWNMLAREYAGYAEGQIEISDNIARVRRKLADEEAENDKKIQQAKEEAAKKTLENYNSLITAMSNTAKESSKLQSSYQALQKGEELSADNLLDLIGKYPIVAQYIAETNDLTLNKGEILKTVLEAEKDHAAKMYQIEADRLAGEIEAANSRIETARIEYEEKAKLVEYYRTAYESVHELPFAESEMNGAKESFDAETEAAKKLQEQLDSIKSRIEAVNTIELTYTATKGNSAAATKSLTSSTQKLTEVTEEYLNSVTDVISETESKIQQELEKTTLSDIEEKEKQISAEQESADKKIKINKIALAKMTADTAENAEERIRLEKEYNDLVSAYQTEYLKKQTDERKKSLEDQQKQYEDLEKSVVESLKKLNEEASEVEQYHLDKKLQAVKTNTDEKITEYRREYDEKIKLIDEASNAEIKALQDKLDALNEEGQSNKSYDNSKKLIDLNQAIVKAQMGDGDLAKAMEAYNAEVKRQQDERIASEKKAERESLQAQIKGIEEAAAEKKKMLKEQNKAMEEAYAEQEKYFTHTADLEIQISETKNEKLKELLQGELDEYRRVNEEKVKLSFDSKIDGLYDEKVNELKAKLAEAKSDTEKDRLKKQLDGIEEFRDEYFENVTLFQEKLNNLAIEAEREASLERQKAAAKQYYAEINETENLKAEARRLMIHENEEEIISLLAQYNEDWKKQGEDYSANMQSGMENGFAGLTEYINQVGKTINSGLSKAKFSKDNGVSKALQVDLTEAEGYIPKYRVLGENISDSFRNGVTPIQKTASDMTSGITETISTGIAETQSVIRTKNDEIVSMLDEYTPKWYAAGEAWGDSLEEGLNLPELIGKVKSAAAALQSAIAGDGNAESSEERFYMDGEWLTEAQWDLKKRQKLANSLSGAKIEVTQNFNVPVEDYGKEQEKAKKGMNEISRELTG